MCTVADSPWNPIINRTLFNVTTTWYSTSMQSVNAILSPILSVNLYASYTLYHMKIHSTRLSRFRDTILVSAPTKHDRYQSMLAILANIMLVLRLGQYPRCAPSQSPYIASSMNLWLRDTRSDITPSSGSEFDIRRVHSPREPPASNVPSLFASCLFTPGVASIGSVSLVCKHRQSKQEQFRTSTPSLRSSKNAWRDATCWWYSISSRVKGSLKPHSPRFTLGHTTGTAATNKDYGYLHRYYGSAKADGNLWQGSSQAHL